MVVPSYSLTWVVDADAVQGIAMKKPQWANVLVAPGKAQVPHRLNPAIVQVCHEALLERGVFTIALSGGSLPSLLSPLQESFDAVGIDPQCWDKWHVLLADERCVPVSDADSNLGALQATLLKNVGIPRNQVYAIDQLKISNMEEVAEAYESIVQNVLSKSNGQLDLAVLGFGPEDIPAPCFRDTTRCYKRLLNGLLPLPICPNLPQIALP